MWKNCADIYMMISFLIGLLAIWFFASSSGMFSVVSTIFWNIVLFLYLGRQIMLINTHHQRGFPMLVDEQGGATGGVGR